MSIYIYEEPEITILYQHGTFQHDVDLRKDLNNLGNGRSVKQWNLMQLLPLCNNTMVVEWINNDNHY